MSAHARLPAFDRRRAVRRLGGLLAIASPSVASLGGCALNSSPRQEFYALDDLKPAAPLARPGASDERPADSPKPAAAAAAGPAPRIDRVLLLTAGASQSMFDSDRMVFSADGVSRAYFQYANWTERPVRRLLVLAERRLARSGAFRAVAPSTSGVRGDLLLTLRLDELFYDGSFTPSRTTISVHGELIDWRSRTFIARHTFTESVQSFSNDARGAAQAAGKAVTVVLDDLAIWVESAAARTLPPS